MSLLGKTQALRKPLAILTIATISAIAALTIGVQASQAISWTGTGTPGIVSFPGYVNAYHTLGTNGGWPEFVMGTVDVYRSPAYSGTQIVTIKESTLVGPTWTPYTTNIQTLTLAPNTYGWDNPKYFSLPYGTFRMAFLVQWRTSTGTLLGSRLVSYDGPNDYHCYSQGYMACQVASDSTGSFVHFFAS